jgi:hypothetical protein
VCVWSLNYSVTFYLQIGNCNEAVVACYHGLTLTFTWRDWGKPLTSQMRVTSSPFDCGSLCYTILGRVSNHVPCHCRRIQTARYLSWILCSSYDGNCDWMLRLFLDKVENSRYCISSVGRDSSVGIATCYGLDVLGSNPVGVRFSAPVQTVPPSLLYNGYRVFPEGKAAGTWRWPPTPSSAEVKEIVELYLYSPSGPS